MSGSIIPREHKDKPALCRVWLLKWDDYIMEPTTDGRSRRVRMQRYRTVKGTRKQADQALSLVTAAKVEGKYVAPDKTTLSDCADTWLAHVEAKGRRVKTLDRYRQLIDKQIRPRLGALPVQHITSATLDNFYARLAKDGGHKGKGLRPRTIQHVHRVMHGILKRAKKNNLVPQNAALDTERPAIEKKKVATFSADEITTILAAFKGRPLYPLVALAFDTGLRRGELCALKWSAVDLDAGTLTVAASISQTSKGRVFTPPKSETSTRTIDLITKSVAELKAHRRVQLEQRLALGLGKLPEDALVFPGDDGKPRDPDAVSRGWKRVLAGLPVKKLSFHATRHSCASRMIEHFDLAAVADRLGHSSTAVTSEFYVHKVEKTGEARKAELEKLDRALAR